MTRLRTLMLLVALPLCGAAQMPAPELSGVVEGRPLSDGHRLPVEIKADDHIWPGTSVHTRDLTLVNRGSRVVHVQSLPSLTSHLPKGEYTLTYLYGGWGQERQVGIEHLGAGRRAFVSDRGRSTSVYAPWFYLHNDTLGTGYLGELAWSGNWEMSFERLPGTGNAPLADQPLTVMLGMRFDFGGALALAPGEQFALPRVAFTETKGDLDDAANQMHRFQRRYVMPKAPANNPPLVQFNSWYPFAEKVDAASLKRTADAAAELGIEVFVLDSGWYVRRDWSKELGDYQPNRAKFPQGLEDFSAYVHQKGMKFGLWVEIENVGTESRLFREHPDWCLQLDGKPLRKDDRYHLNFAKPEVRAWAHATLDRLIRDYRLDWVKIDYNIDIGSEFDPSGPDRPGDVLYRHITSYYRWLDELRAKHPALIVENCSSGGLRFDLGILGHTHTTWLSDMVNPVPSLALGYGCTVQFAPEACNHWMVGDADDGKVEPAKPAAYWDFLFRVPMNGQFGISSRIFDWPVALTKRAAENVALYKRVRTTIQGADVYHLTPPPAHNGPQGWMAIQYVSPETGRSVVFAYRLARSEPNQVFHLRGLDPARQYQVTGGASLGSQGLTVSLDSEWRAAAIEITPMGR